MKTAEGKYGGKWDPEEIGLTQLESDPICSSAGCTQYKRTPAPPGPPMDYPVPDFGVDIDIKDHNENLAVA